MKFENTTNMAQSDENVLLAYQPSIFSMTFDELQMTGGLGKDFGSMNMEDLFKNISTAEEGEGNCVNGVIAKAACVNLQRQGSLILPRTLGLRTVEEVWNDLIKEKGVPRDVTGFKFSSQKEPTLGELTLEEFLARAGVAKEDIKPLENSGSVEFYGDINGSTFGLQLQPVADEITGTNNNGVSSSSSFTLNNNVLRSSQQLQQSQPLLQPIFPKQRQNEIIGISEQYPGDQHTYMTSKSNLSSSPRDFNLGVRGRRSSCNIEKQVERRQRRMIKNRESATRSRARKQAYTTELEEEIAKLKEVNKELQKNRAELMEMQKKQIMESLKSTRGANRSCLRRTMTGPW